MSSATGKKSPVTCNKCKQVFCSLPKFKSHVLGAHRTYQCGHCDNIFNTVECARLHHNLQHSYLQIDIQLTKLPTNWENQYMDKSSSFCRRGRPSKSKAQAAASFSADGIASADGVEYRYYCAYCNYVDSNIDVVKKHKEQAHKSLTSDNIMSCRKCNYTAPLDDLNKHYSECHDKGNPQFLNLLEIDGNTESMLVAVGNNGKLAPLATVLAEFTKNTNNSDGYKRVVAADGKELYIMLRPNIKKKFTCTDCNIIFDDINRYDVHNKYIHPKGISPSEYKNVKFFCPLCSFVVSGYTGQNFINIRNHVKYYHDWMHDTFSCRYALSNIFIGLNGVKRPLTHSEMSFLKGDKIVNVALSNSKMRSNIGTKKINGCQKPKLMTVRKTVTIGTAAQELMNFNRRSQVNEQTKSSGNEQANSSVNGHSKSSGNEWKKSLVNGNSSVNEHGKPSGNEWKKSLVNGNSSVNGHGKSSGNEWKKSLVNGNSSVNGHGKSSGNEWKKSLVNGNSSVNEHGKSLGNEWKKSLVNGNSSVNGRGKSSGNEWKKSLANGNSSVNGHGKSSSNEWKKSLVNGNSSVNGHGKSSSNEWKNSLVNGGRRKSLVSEQEKLLVKRQVKLLNNGQSKLSLVNGKSKLSTNGQLDLSINVKRKLPTSGQATLPLISGRNKLLVGGQSELLVNGQKKSVNGQLQLVVDKRQKLPVNGRSKLSIFGRKEWLNNGILEWPSNKRKKLSVRGKSELLVNGQEKLSVIEHKELPLVRQEKSSVTEKLEAPTFQQWNLTVTKHENTSPGEKKQELPVDKQWALPVNEENNLSIDKNLQLPIFKQWTKQEDLSVNETRELLVNEEEKLSGNEKLQLPVDEGENLSFNEKSEFSINGHEKLFDNLLKKPSINEVEKLLEIDSDIGKEERMDSGIMQVDTMMYDIFSTDQLIKDQEEAKMLGTFEECIDSEQINALGDDSMDMFPFGRLPLKIDSFNSPLLNDTSLQSSAFEIQPSIHHQPIMTDDDDNNDHLSPIEMPDNYGVHDEYLLSSFPEEYDNDALHLNYSSSDDIFRGLAQTTDYIVRLIKHTTVPEQIDTVVLNQTLQMEHIA